MHLLVIFKFIKGYNIYNRFSLNKVSLLRYFLKWFIIYNRERRRSRGEGECEVGGVVVIDYIIIIINNCN